MLRRYVLSLFSSFFFLILFCFAEELLVEFGRWWGADELLTHNM